MDSAFDPEASALWREFAEQTSDFVGISDPWGRVLYLNPAARKRLGVAEATDLTVADFFPAEAITLYYEVIRPQVLRHGSWSGEVPVNVSGGDPVPMYVSTTARLGPGGETNGNVVYAHELPRRGPAGVTERSRVDDGTGVLERSAFIDRVRLALAAADRDGADCALVVAEIVGITEAIDMFGAPVAERAMRSLAGRMTRLSRTIDVVGRVGQQRFGLLLHGVRDRGEALRIARTVHDSLVDPPVTTAGGEAVATVSIGVAYSEPGIDPVVLIYRASAALTHESERHDVASVVDASPEGSGALATIDEFRVGMSRGDVKAYAEPVVDLRSGLVVGYRGLARWQHRRLGMIKAVEFIDMISETPIANQVDLYIARETAAVLALAARSSPMRLYTPVSKRLIADVRTEQYLSEIADAFFLSNNQIRLQIERVFLDSWSPALRDALQSLRDVEVGLALTRVEDKSEVPDLVAHPFEELHISRRLTSDARMYAGARRSVSEIAQLAHEHGALVAAVGVVDEEHRALLLDAGCDLATGELYGRPEPTDSID